MSQHCLAHRHVAPAASSRPIVSPERRELDRVLVSLFDAPRPVVLPSWSYSRWCLMLQYPDLSPRARATTRLLGRERDAVLTQAGVRALIDWAGRRRRSEPAAAAAAALVVLRQVQTARSSAPVDLAALAVDVVAAIDEARPVAALPRRRSRRLVDADWLPDIEVDPPGAENPHLSAAVAGLLDLTELLVEKRLATRIEDAVVLAGDWWARHPCPVPASTTGPSLPGIALAQTLPVSERLSTMLPDPGMRRLVAGPRPGCKRPSQLAWRRGLTFWVAAWLSSENDPPYPGADVRAWWQGQLTHLSLATGHQDGSSGGSRCRRVDKEAS